MLKTDIFEILKKIGHGLALTIGKHWLIEAIARFALMVSSIAHSIPRQRGRTSAAGAADTHRKSDLVALYHRLLF